AHRELPDDGERRFLVRAAADSGRHREPQHAPGRRRRVPEPLTPHAGERVGARQRHRHARRRGAQVLRPGTAPRLTGPYFSAARIAAGPPFTLTRWPVSLSSAPDHWNTQ